jgi:hypothetical protein
MYFSKRGIGVTKRELILREHDNEYFSVRGA